MNSTEDLDKLQAHLILCGWKQDMNLVVREVLRVEPSWREKGIVVLARVTDEAVAEFRADKDLEWVQIIRDDFFNEAALLRAGIKRAGRAMVFADWSDRNETVTETDAKTVMAAMAIEKLAPQTYVVTELLDMEFLQYLKMARVDEIVYSREYSRVLLANAIASPGVTHAVFDLMDPSMPTDLGTAPIAPEFEGKKFSELAAHYESLKMICIGVLENTGNIHTLKTQALIKAQKFPQMRTVMKNLSKVKEIECNHPRINPGDEYVIENVETTRAIVIRDRVSQEMP